MSLLPPVRFHQHIHDATLSAQIKEGEYRRRESTIFNYLPVLL